MTLLFSEILSLLGDPHVRAWRSPWEVKWPGGQYAPFIQLNAFIPTDDMTEEEIRAGKQYDGNALERRKHLYYHDLYKKVMRPWTPTHEDMFTADWNMVRDLDTKVF